MDFTSYFSNFKKTLEGRDDYYFLVNDSNNEIRQHYDNSYHVNFNLNDFLNSFYSKKTFLNNKDISYNFFIIPDKSVSMRKYLPFDTQKPYRIADFIANVGYDLLDIIEEDDILKNDTHPSPLSSLKIVSYILSKIEDKDYELFYNDLSSKLHEVVRDHKGDLFFDVNWSYPKDERFIRNAHVDIPFLELDDKYDEVDISDIPEEFRKVSRRESFYYKNPNSISDKRALIYRDSSTIFLMPVFIAYYREVFFYWDHWYFNRDLVEWFKPDDVIEIRTERLLNNALYPSVDNDFTVQQKLIIKDELFENKDDNISWQFTLMNSYNLLIDSTAWIYLDDKLLETVNIESGLFSFTYDFSDYPLGMHSIRIVIPESESTVEEELSKQFFINPKVELSHLKLSLRGKNNTYFLVNDSNHELLQHYFYDYKSTFNLHDFKLALDSKRRYFQEKNIKFSQFIIPDKSVLLKQLLPFETGVVLRHIDKLTNYYYDLLQVLDMDDYLSNDTKLTDNGALKSALFIYSKIQVDDEDIREHLLDRLYFKEVDYHGDLFHKPGWSYNFDDEYINNHSIRTEVLEYVSPDDITQLDIPMQFRQFNKTESSYYRNDNPIMDKRVLVLTDKGIHPFTKILTSIFTEVFFYHDYWYFNYDLIEYFHPDIVIELRCERTLDNALTNIISTDGKTLIPIIVKLKDFSVEDDNLHINVVCEDLRKLSVDTDCKFFIDEEVVCEDKLIDGCVIFDYDLQEYDEGSHELNIRIEEGIDTKAKLITETFEK